MKTQTKFRKFLSVFLSLAFILSMATLPVSVNAYDPITVTASTVDGAEGTDVVVSLSITANSGLATGTMLLKYDTTKLTYKSKTFGPAQGELNGFNANYANDGNIRTIYYSPVHTEGITEGGVMVNITFTCLAGWTGAALLELTASEMVDAGYSPLSFTAVNGSVNIPTPITPKTISFNTDGGSAVASINGMPGTAVTAPADPTKTGFTFAGWSPALPAEFPDNDISLTALWTPAGVTLTVADGSGAVGDTVSIAVNISANSGLAAADLFLTFDNTKLTYVGAIDGTAAAGALSSIVAQPPADELTTIRQGFALDNGLSDGGSMMILTFTINPGWEGTTTPLTLTVEDFFNDDYDPITPTINNGEVECLAPQTYTISFNTNGGNAIASVTGLPGTDVPDIANPVKAGFIFTGWDPAIPATFPSNNVTVDAQWVTETAIVLSASDVIGVPGSNVVVSISVTADSALATGTILLQYDTTKLTYVSRSFGPAQGELNGFNANYANAGDIRTIYYSPVSTEGITAGGAMVNITFTVLAGWTGSSALELSASEVVDKDYNEIAFIAEDGSVTVAAQSTITFDVNGGTPAIASITQDEGTNVTAPANPTRAGYTFEGWQPAIPATMPVDNLTCVAQWNKNQSTITFDTNGGLPAIAPITQDEGTVVTPPASPTKAGYSFLGWDPSVPATMPEDNLTCVAQWDEIEPVILTVTDASGAVGDSVVVYVNISADSALAAAELFLAFDNTKLTLVNAADGTAVAGGISSVAAQAPVGDITTIKQSFAIDGGITAGGSMMIITFTIKSGWTGTTPLTLTVGDFTDDSYNTLVNNINNGEITFNPAPTSTIAFDSAGGSAVASITQDEGTAVTAPADPTKAGYNFKGWQPAVPASMPEDNVTCVAQWAKIVTVTFYFDNGTGPNIYDVEVGDVINEPAAPTRAGYTFTGWFYDAELTMPVEWPITVTDPGKKAAPNAPGDTEFYAGWEAEQYMVVFEASGGEGGSSGMMDFGAPLVPPTVTREGYTFNRWSPTPPSTVEIGGGMYYAMWDINTYTITFDVDGGTPAIDPITQQFDTTVIAPADPTKAGFTFEGWLPAVPGMMPAANTTCVAQWAPIVIPMITISFNTDGGSAVAPIMGEMGSPVTPPAAPTKAGFTFMGWNPGLPSAFPQYDIEVTAVWQALPQSTITFNTDGGSPVASITLDEGAPVTEPMDPTKNGYTFAGWEPVVPKYMPVDDVTCVAQWDINTYTITFDSMGGTPVAAITQEFGTAVTEPADPTRPGYTFAGWDTDIPSTMPSANLFIYAQWTINSYPITFDAAGGTGGWSMSMEYGASITAPVVTREGYTFNRWDPTPPATVEGAATFYAMWDINSYTITFDVDGGTPAIDPITQQFGTTVVAPADPTKAGFTFEGWLPAVPGMMPAANTTCVAQWEEIVVPMITISFNSDGGSAVAPIMGEMGSPVTAPASPTRAGFTFMGWNPTLPSTFPQADIEVTAVWQALPQSTINFDTDGGSVIAPMTGYVDAPVTAPADPTKAGFTFVGWEPEIPSTFPEQNLTVVAQWEEIVIVNSTITFDTAGGSAIAPITGEVGTPVTPPAAPTKAGFTFIGWLPVIPATFPEQSMTVVAQWEEVLPETSTITFDTAGGSAIAPMTGNVGSAVTAPANPAKEGYTFKGWAPTIPGTFPADDLTVVAQWEKNEDVPPTGDTIIGVAVFAAFSAAAAAAFVARKKKED